MSVAITTPSRSMTVGAKPPPVTAVQSLFQRTYAGMNISDNDVLKAMSEYMQQNPYTLVPLLSLMSLKGKPYSLKRHFAMEPLYKRQMPRQMVWKCGRQVGKSASLASAGILRAAGTQDLRMLFVTPRYEQVRRLSSNYVRPLISNSLISKLLVDEACVQHVLQRSFINRSTMYFSFAFLDVDRIRGLSTDINIIDEVQDMDFDFLPIINECMTASEEFGISLYSGTPKTLENSIEALWLESSKGEWVTPCHACGYWSMACIHADLMKMIGLKTVVCARCQKPINPANGHWHHVDGKDHSDFHGYHVPQIILPMHYRNEEKWGILIGKRDGKQNCSPTKFLNEVLGESADVGVKLVTQTDVKKASTLGRNTFDVAMKAIKKCPIRVLGVDWGGGGEEEISFTTCALIGLNPFNGKCECHYAYRFHAAHTHDEEVKELLKIFAYANCQYLAHDFGGSGSVRETLMIQAGLPMHQIMNMLYVKASSHNMVRYHPPPPDELRGFYAVDKARSLVLQATSLKGGLVLLPEYETSKNVTEDLQHLMEDKHEMPSGADIYLIKRVPKKSDDFAHALNFGCLCIYHTGDAYPDLSKINNMKLSQQQLKLADPPNAFKESDGYETRS